MTQVKYPAGVVISERVKVGEWRAEVAEKLGAPIDVQIALGEHHSVDLHRWMDLVGMGCAPALAYQIVREE